MTVRNWRRGHRWLLLFAFAAALAGSLAVPAAGGMLLAGAGTGLRLKAAWLGRRERADDVLLWVRVDWLGPRSGAPAGKPVKAYRATGIAAATRPRAGRAARGGVLV